MNKAGYLCNIIFGSLWGASLVAQMVKNLSAMQETLVWTLGQEDPLDKKMTTLSSILPWKIPWTEEHGGLQSMGSQKSQTRDMTQRLNSNNSETKRLGLGVRDEWRSDNICLYSFISLEFPNSADKDALSPPGRRRIPSHGSFISHYQGAKGMLGFYKYHFFHHQLFPKQP